MGSSLVSFRPRDQHCELYTISGQLVGKLWVKVKAILEKSGRRLRMRLATEPSHCRSG